MSLEDSKNKKNYSNVAPLSTKKGRIHARKLKIKQALEPVKKAITKVAEWVKEDLKNAKPRKFYRKYPSQKKDWENIH